MSLSGLIHRIADVNSKIRGAQKAGYKRIVIPTDSYNDVLEGLRSDSQLEILQACDVVELLNHCLIDEHSE